MKSVQSRFQKIQNSNPELGDYICLMQAVRGQKFNRVTISQWFNKLISKDDFYPKERNRLVAQLYQSSNCVEDMVFETEIASGQQKTIEDDAPVTSSDFARK